MTNSPDAARASTAIRWHTRGDIDLSEFATARVIAINLAQWLVRVANSYVTNHGTAKIELEFDPHDAVFVTRPFENGLTLGVRLPSLEMQFRDHGKPVPHPFDPEERSPAEAEAWILVELLHRGIDREKFSTILPYTIPGLMSGDAEDYSPQACKPGLGQLTALFQDAATVLDAATRSDRVAALPIICCPKTLDLRSALDATSDYLGFSPGDARNREPHFFVQNAARGGAAGAARRLIANATALIAENGPLEAAAKLHQLAAS